MTAAEMAAVANGPYAAHVTTEGQRWDQIADLYYGDPFRYEVLIAANSDLPIVPILDAGLRVLVPILDQADTLSADLPPWKR